MRIKKHPSGNEYIASGDIWVRNFTKSKLAPIQLSHQFSADDYSKVLENEELNKNHPKISNEHIYFKKIVIVSDGYQFEEKHKIFSNLAKDVMILAVNEALKKWSLMSYKLEPHERKTINAYVVNNPYDEAESFVPKKDSKYYPTCIASTRTNKNFTQKYSGDIYTYCPTMEEKFGLQNKEEYYVDDYRNPICAAIGLAYQFGVEKLMLFCCDESFENKRDYAVQLKNGLWTYPQNIKAHELIDANLFWLKHQKDREIKVVDASSGPEYVNAAYISDKEALDFFVDQEEGTADAQ